MAPRAFGSALVWLLIAVLGVGTFGLRLSFIQLRGWFEQFPAALERALAFVPAAILAALVFPALVAPGEPGVAALANARAIAGVLAGAVAWRTGSMMATIVVGMGALWVVRAII